MDKKKIAKILLSLGIGVCTIGSVSLATACGGDGGSGGGSDTTKYTVTIDYNYTGDSDTTLSVDENGKINVPNTPSRSGYTFEGWYKDPECNTPWDFDNDTVTGNTTIYAKWIATHFTVTFNSNGGSAVDPLTNVERGSTIQEPTAPTNTNGSGITFGGWYKESTFETLWDFTTDTVEAETELYARWLQEVETSVNFVGIATSLGSPTDNVTPNAPTDYQGIITFGQGMRFEPTATREGLTGCVNTQNVDTSVITLSGATNSIKIRGRGASNGGLIIYRLNDGDVREDVFGTTDGTTLGTLVNDTVLVTIEQTDLPAGTYYMECINSMRIYEFIITQTLTLGTPESVVAGGVTATTDEILVGTTGGADLLKTGVTAQIQYDNNTIQTKNVDPSKITFEPGFNINTAGVYTASFDYEENGQTVSGSYQVKVYAIKSLILGEYKTSGSTTTNLQKVYTQGETLDTSVLTVIGVGATSESETDTKQFILTANTHYTIGSVDLSTVGEKPVTVTLRDAYKLSTTAVTASYNVNVIAGNLKDSVSNGVLNITVNPAETLSITNYHTITDAIMAIENAEIASNVMKEIAIADGEYYEKVYINTPNVHLKGSALSGTNLSATVNNNVVIWFDALNGTTDPAGSSHSTNGSASVTIGSGATGFRAENITFKNKYNTHALYTESQGLTSNTQAVALYIDAEKSAFYNCKFTSYHDTLYANSGSHYYDGCWIEGRTDYIFGKNAISYFKSCNIWSIGAGAEVNNGGYVVATQRDAGNAGVYVFDACNFDGDANVKDGSVALGRAWSVNIRMVIMNSQISGKFSRALHTAGGSQAQRYCTMSGHEPNPANLIEYKNTGAGALYLTADAGVDGGLTQIELDAYAALTCTYTTTEADINAFKLTALFTDWDPTSMTYVTINLLDNATNIGTIKVYEGTTIAQADIAALIDANEIPANKELDKFCTSNAVDVDYTFGKVTSGTVDIYVKWKDTVATSVVATYEMTVSTAIAPASGSEGVFTETGCVYESNTLKFDHTADRLTITLNADAGQTLAITITGRCASSSGATGVKVYSITNGSVVGEDTVPFSLDSNSTGINETGVINCTVTATGQVVIQLGRSEGRGTRIVTLKVEVSQPEA